jgi:hypothetical protein
LRLPPEIRNKIWRYAVGGLDIHIREIVFIDPVKLSYAARPVGAHTYHPPFAFHLHKVSRQVYVEVCPLIYALNTFAFDYVSVMDRWIRARPVGQMQLITSMNITSQYFWLYVHGYRKTFRKKFPHVKRIGICEWSYRIGRRMGETVEEAKERIVKLVHRREGDGVTVEW